MAALGVVVLGLAALIVQDAAVSRENETFATNPGRLLWTRFEKAKTAEERRTLAAEAKALLREEPLNARASSLIAAMEAQDGRTVKADELMRATFRLNRRDIAVNAWLFDKELQARRYDTAFQHADIMLRRNQALGQLLYPALLGATADPSAIKPLAQTLKAEPLWRTPFLAGAVADQRTLQVVPTLMAAIQAEGGRIPPNELGTLLQGLIAAERYDQAYLNWLLFIPIDDLSKLTNVYDGDFDGWPQVTPFTWLFGPGISGAIDPTGSLGRPGSALHVAYDGLSVVQFPRQMLMLTPGAYRFSGEYLTPTEETQGLLTWRLTCVEAEKPIADFTTGSTARQWRGFAVDFAVPTDCKAQWLTLVANPGERRVSAEAWFDKVAVDAVGRDE